LLSDASRTALLAALMDAGRAVAFGCGVELLPPAQIDLESPTLQRAQMEILERQTAQRRAEGQMDQMRRSAELFAQFQAIRASAPDLSPGQVLSRIGLADQAELLRSLLLASAGQAPRPQAWAVAGPYLIGISADDSPSPRLIAVPDALGPLRSLRPDGANGLLLGCRSGVMRIDPRSPDAATLYHDPEVNSQLGFNAAVLWEEHLWASHSQAGLVCWKLDQPENCQKTIRPATASIAGFSPRNLTFLSSHRLLFSSGGQLAGISSQGELTCIDTPAVDIVALFAHERRVLTVHADGLLCLRGGEDLHVIGQQRRTGRISAAAALPWLGDWRYLLAGEDGPTLCVGLDDELITQYSSMHAAPRMTAGAAGAVAAVTADRQRLLLWHSWEGRKPYAELHLYGLARHRIADVIFA
jgi:hypothetical protein